MKEEIEDDEGTPIQTDNTPRPEDGIQAVSQSSAPVEGDEDYVYVPDRDGIAAEEEA